MSASKITKLTTGLTGLDVLPNSRNIIKALYERTLELLERMPKNAYYRQTTEVVINNKLNTVKNTPDETELENKLGMGQLEEVAAQARNEMNLARKMLNWKPWEPLIEEPPNNQWKWPI